MWLVLVRMGFECQAGSRLPSVKFSSFPSVSAEGLQDSISSQAMPASRVAIHDIPTCRLTLQRLYAVLLKTMRVTIF